jgi:hypothetical protein
LQKQLQTLQSQVTETKQQAKAAQQSAQTAQQSAQTAQETVQNIPAGHAALPTKAAAAPSYWENDWLGAGVTANSRESNSYNLRMRQAWLFYDNDNYHFNVLPVRPGAC